MRRDAAVAAGLCTTFIVTETVTKSDADIGMVESPAGLWLVLLARRVHRLPHGQLFHTPIQIAR
jgi:hypothetical protein